MATLKVPSFLGPIVPESLEFLGPLEKDLVTGIRVIPGDIPNEIFAEIEIDYKPGFELTLKTEVFVDWPTKRYASIPLTIVVKILNVTGKLHVYAPPRLNTQVFACFSANSLPDINLDATVVMGRKDIKITSLPKVRDFICGVIHKILRTCLVYPGRIQAFAPFPGRKLDINLINATSTTNTTRIREGPFWTDSESHYQKMSLIARFIDEVLNHGKFEVMDELTSSEITLVGGNLLDVDVKGRKAVRDYIMEIHEGFPDIIFYTQDIGVTQDEVICQLKARGTNEGSFWGFSSSGQEMLMHVLMVTTIQENLITRQQYFWSPASILKHKSHTAAI